MTTEKHIEILAKLAKESNTIYFQDKLTIYIKIYYVCKTANDIWENLNLREVNRFVGNHRHLLDRKMLGREKYITIMEMFKESVEKYS